MQNNFAGKANFIWSVADLIRDTFKRGRYQEEMTPLSEIVALLNERFGLNVSAQEGEAFVARMLAQLLESQTLADSVAVNTPENARLTFTEVINDMMQDMLDVNFKFYKLYAEQPRFAEFLRDVLYERYLREHGEVAGP